MSRRKSKGSRHGGLVYYPGVSLDSVEVNPRNFTRFVEEGAWFCNNSKCDNCQFIIADGDRDTIWNDNTGEVHYQTSRDCRECQFPMVFVGFYTEIIYVSQVFKDRVQGVLRNL